MRRLPNTHPNPLSGYSEDCPDDEDLDLDSWQDPQPDEDIEGQIWAAKWSNTL